MKSKLDVRRALRLPLLGLAALAIVLSGCLFADGCSFGSCPSSISFDGNTYTGASAQSLEIGPQDLTEIGTIETDDPQLLDGTVYALDGLDPAELVVMRLEPGPEGDYVLYSRGQLQITPALCGYYAQPSPECES